MAQDRSDTGKALRLQLLNEALAVAGIGGEHLEALQRLWLSNLESFLGTDRHVTFRGRRVQFSEKELPFQGEVDEAPVRALRARCEYSSRIEGFPVPAEDEDPYQVDEGDLSIHVLYTSSNSIASSQLSKALRAKPTLRFGRAMAHFCFLESKALGRTSFQVGGRKVQSASYGSTLEQLGIADGDCIECMPLPASASWPRAALS